jgi:hypothetical protein
MYQRIIVKQLRSRKFSIPRRILSSQHVPAQLHRPERAIKCHASIPTSELFVSRCAGVSPEIYPAVPQKFGRAARHSINPFQHQSRWTPPRHGEVLKTRNLTNPATQHQRHPKNRSETGMAPMPHSLCSNCLPGLWFISHHSFIPLMRFIHVLQSRILY